jgi:hypothetical protein
VTFRYCVIREGRELWLLPEELTAEEREEIAERQRSPEARRQFGARLRKARRIEGKPLKDALKAAGGKLLARAQKRFAGQKDGDLNRLALTPGPAPQLPA